MRICRIYDYPTESFPGAGLAGYQYSREMEAPTLYLARKREGFLEVPGHVDLRPVSFYNPPFGEKITFIRTMGKLAGLTKFFLASVPHMARFKPDIVHIHSPLYIAQAVFCRYFLGSAVFQTFHGSGLLRVEKSRFLQKILLRVVDGFFYVSKSMRPGLEKFVPPERMVYTPNGVDTDVFEDISLQRKKQIVAVGTLRWQKGYRYLLEAFSKISDPEYKLLIIGEGPLRNELESLIEELGLSGRVSLPGFRDREGLVEALNTSSIYVMSSVSEGFPKAVLEAMACGLPVVLTDTGSCSELSRGAGVCVPPADPGALAEALDALIRDEHLRTEFAKAARETAEKYGWNEPAQLVYKSYEKILTERRR